MVGNARKLYHPRYLPSMGFERNSMEGVKDVQSGDVRAGTPGLQV